jgi:hypothetical protein
LNNLGFALLRLGQRPDANILARTQCAGDDGDALQMVWQKIVSALDPTLLKGHFRDLGVRQCRVEIMQTAQTRHVRNGFNIEDENGLHTKLDGFRMGTRRWTGSDHHGRK